MEATLDAYDIPDKGRYFMPPQVAAATAGGQPQQGHRNQPRRTVRV